MGQESKITEEDILKELARICADLIENQVELDEEDLKLLREHLWELYS